MKKRVMTSYENLSDELRELLKERYPLGFTDYMSRVDKPNGDFFYGVMLETEEIMYFVKSAVKVDDVNQDDIDKDLFAGDDDSADLKGAEEIADIADDEE